MHKYTTKQIARFWNKVDLPNTIGTDECWNWKGVVGNTDYGRFSAFGKYITASRFSYQMACGDIPNGLLICHTCDNPLCVNPSHLFAGTQVENVADAIKKGRHYSIKAKERSYPPHKKTPQVLMLLESHYTHAEIARMLKIGTVTVAKIARANRR